MSPILSGSWAAALPTENTKAVAPMIARNICFLSGVRSPLSVDSLHFVRRIWWLIDRLGAMIAEPIRPVPIGAYGERPQLAGTVRADVNRRIIQNCPHS